MPSIKNEVPRAKWFAQEPLLCANLVSCLFSRVGKPSCGQVIFPVHVILPLKVPTGQFCQQLHVIGLSRCMYDTYQMNFKYVLYRRGGLGGCSVILEHSSSHNIPNFIVQHKEGFDWWKLKIRYCALFLFFFFCI